MTAKTEFPINGLNLIAPPHELREGQVIKSQNMIPSFGKIEKVKGTTKYNGTTLGTKPVTWEYRYYGRRADNTEIKKIFCYYDGAIYVGDDVTGAMTSVASGFTKGTYPLSEVMQVSGNAVLYFFNDGEDVPYTYNGNDGNVWEKSSTTLKPVMGVSWLDRLWVFEKNSSILLYSKTLYPEDFTDSTDAGEIQVGISKKEIITGLVRYQDTLFIFTDRRIYNIEGRTPSTFQLREVHASLGCSSKLSIVNLEDSFVFLGSDHELYKSSGYESNTVNITQEIMFSNLINPNKANLVVCGYHKHFLRVSYEPFSQEVTNTYNSWEIVANMLDPNERGLPKWGQTNGANISCYSVWDRFGDRNYLVTGRSDTGLLMYHERTNNWDGRAIEVILRTRDIVFSLAENARIKDIYIHGKTNGVNTFELRTYLDGRTGTNSSNDFTQEGEVYHFGAINIPNQVRFGERIIPGIDYSKGQSISFEIYNNSVDKVMELYSFTFNAYVREKKLGQKVAG